MSDDYDPAGLKAAAIGLDYAAACDRTSPSYVYRPKLFIDGDRWCALYGENIQTGVCAFGETPAKAYSAFDEAWHAEVKMFPAEATATSACDNPFIE